MKLRKIASLLLMVMAFIFYGCGGGGGTSATPEELVLGTKTATVGVGDSSFQLPQFGKIRLSDDTYVNDVAISWDVAPDTSKAGTFTFKGSAVYDKVTLEVTFTLTVVVIPPGETIVSVELLTNKAEVNLNDNFTLPITAKATTNNSTVKELAVTWDKVPDTTKEGVFNFTGTIEGTTLTVAFELTVKDGVQESIVALTLEQNSATVKAGTQFALPIEAIATTNKNTTKKVAITWDKTVDTKLAGTYQFTGSAAETTLKVNYVLVVTDVEPDITITGIKLAPTSAEIEKGSAFILPQVGTAMLSNGTEKTVIIEWDKAPDVNAVGIQVFTGKAKGETTDKTVTFQLTVKETVVIYVKDVVLKPSTATVNQNDSFVLPGAATVIMSDNSTKEAAITWDKAVSTLQPGVFTFTGSVAGTDKSVVFQLTVTEVIVVPTIVSLSVSPSSASVVQNSTFTLPTLATAKMSNGTTKEVAVTWDKAASTAIAGLFNYTGSVSGTAVTVVFTLEVTEAPKPVELNSIKLSVSTATVFQNAVFTLPTTATATMSNGTTKEVAVTWDKAAITTVLGIYTYTASYTEGSKTATAVFTLAVESNPVAVLKTIELNPATATVKQNAVFTLPTTATATMSDSKTKEVAVTWNKAAATTALGTYTYTASYTEGNVTATAIFTLVVESNPVAVLKTIELNPATATVKQNAAFTLPTTATATMSDSKTKEVAVTWNKAAATTALGTYTYTASYTEGNVTATAIFTLVVESNPVAVLKTIELNPATATVKQNAVFTLPTTATATMSDSKTKEVAVTWNKAATTTALGTYTYTASYTEGNVTATAIFTLVVESNPVAILKTIELNPATATVKQNAAFTLPTTATATMSDSKTKEVAVTWNKAATTTALGTYTYTASYTEGNVTATAIFTLVVESNPVAILKTIELNPATATVKQNAAFTLPTTATATMSDSKTKEVAVTWNKAATTTALGTYTYTASYTEGNVTATAVFTLVVESNPVAVLKTIELNPATATVKQNTVFALPTTATATMSDTTTKIVTVTWNKAATTTALGTTTYTASYTEGNVTATAIFTLVVESNPVAVLKTIELNPATATVKKGAVFTLPTTGTATMSDAATKTVTVTWDKTATTATAGTTTYTASYTEGSVTATAIFTLVVEEEITVTDFIIATTYAEVYKGASYTLPASGTVKYSNGTTKTATITWDKAVSTATIGTFEYVGTCSDTIRTVIFTLKVLDNTKPLLEISDMSVQQGETFDVTINASFFQKNVSGYEITLGYDTAALEAVGTAEVLGSFATELSFVKAPAAGQIMAAAVVKNDTGALLSGPILKFKFKAKTTAGTTNISFIKTNVIDTSSVAYLQDVQNSDKGIINIGGGTANNKLLVSDVSGYTNGTVDVKVSAAEFTENSLGVQTEIVYDTAYLELARDGNGDVLSSVVTALNGSINTTLKVVKETTPGKLTVSLISTNGTPMVLNGDIFKVTFKIKTKTGTTAVSLGEVKIANSTNGYITGINSSDIGNVTIEAGTTNAAFEISDITIPAAGYFNVKLSGKDFTTTATGIEFNISYDATFMDIESLAQDITLVGALAGGQKIVSSPSAGKVKIAVVIYNQEFSLNGNLVDVKFKSKGKTGTTNISYDKVDAGNTNADGMIPAVITDKGVVTFSQIVAVPTTVELSSDKTAVTPGTTVTFSANVKDQNGNIMSSETTEIYQGTTKLTGNTFSTTTEGSYTFTAKSGTLTSSSLTVTVKAEQPTGEYYSTNPKGQVGQNKTITGIADWTESMKIAQGVAADTPRNWLGYHEYPDPDLYAMFAAWDSTNLYLMVEMPHIDDVDTIDNDKSYAGSQFLPMGWAIKTGKRTPGNGLMTDGYNVWTKGKFFTFENGIDTIIMHHPRLNIGTPGFFVTNAEGKFGYTADILFSFADKGIKRDVYFQKSVSANIWAAVDANGNFGGKTGVDMSKYNYIDIKATKKMTSYQITIPLASLGIDKSYIETTGIEAAVFSTYGESTMDILPWSPSMIDNASKPYSKDTSTSSEKEDYDPLVQKLARIGKI